MRWLARIFASAVARRVAYVLVAMLLAWLGMGRASAAVAGCTGGGLIWSCQDAGQAYAQASVAAADFYPGAVNCSVVLEGDSYRARFTRPGYSATCPSGYGSAVVSFPAGKTCATRVAPETHPWIAGGGSESQISCESGCSSLQTVDVYGLAVSTWTGAVCTQATLEQDCSALEGFVWYPFAEGGGGRCAQPPPECPEGQEKVDGVCKTKETCPAGQHTNAAGECEEDMDTCPAGQVKSPEGGCLPADGQCGEGKAQKEDGTCGVDADGDGVADADEDTSDPDKPTFSGGDSCDAPPSCSGDAIACGQARIQWRIDCNTRADANIRGGACSAMPVCTGRNCKADEYAQLILQWRATCAVEKLAEGAGGIGEEGSDSANIKDIRDAVMSGGDPGEEGSPDGAFATGTGGEGGNGAGGEAGELDQSGFGWTRTCPTIPDVDIMGQSIHFDTSIFCNWVKLGGQLVLVFAALMSLRIISGGTTMG